MINPFTRCFLLCLLSLSWTIGSHAAVTAAADREKPNIILINVDDLGWTDLACFGSKFYQTPQLDKLCAEGMKFTNAYAASAVCSPSRASIMTGRSPARTGITDWIRAGFQGGKIVNGKNPIGYDKAQAGKLSCPKNPLFMEHAELTIAELLEERGYTTVHIGKWHLGGAQWGPSSQGFEVNIGGCDFGQPPSYYDPYSNKKLGGIAGIPGRNKGEFLTKREADEAVAFIASHKDKPFFINLCHYAVHTPIQGDPRFLEKYKKGINGLTAHGNANYKNQEYASMIEGVDHSTGEIIAALKKHGLTENTLVIFTSDNGGALSVTDNAPLRSGKGFAYEGGIRVPQIAYWPGTIKPGSVCDVPVNSVDFFPTFAAVAKAPLPDHALDGENTLPLLTGTGELKRDTLYWHYPHYRQNSPPYSIIRKGKWKLIKQYDGAPYQLYDLEADLSEKRDLAESMPEKVKQLDAQLKRHLVDTGAKLPKKGEPAVKK